MKDYTIYVTEEIAKKAMEKGFECSYDNDDYTPHFRVGNPDGGFIYILPTAEQICGWLREEKGIDIDVITWLALESGEPDGYIADIWKYKYHVDGLNIQPKKKYEDSLREGINKALDLI